MGRVIAEGIGTVYVSKDGGALNAVAFHEGDEVPDWAAKQMGDHCFEGLGETDEAAEEAPDEEAPDEESTPGDEDSEEDEEAVDYEAKTIPELEAEIAARNEGRDDEDLIEVGGKGNKPDLVAALQADDVAQANQG